MKVKNYTELIAWQKAMDLTRYINEATKEFPAEERFGLRLQMSRAGVSVPSNIAEGQGRDSAREFLHFLSIAHGSVREIETQVRISGKLGFLRDETVTHLMNQASEVGRLIKGLSNSLLNR